jgi:hypothetical protein
MRTALLAVASVWILGCVWSYQEQSAFAASKGFTFPHLLPLVIDGFAVSMAGVAWAASLDARPAIPARLATVVAVGASSASNGVWAYLRAHHDIVTVMLGVAVPVAANLAFEVLLAELRRQVQRRRGLPPPVAVPYPRLIRMVLAPWRTFREWRAMVLEITAMDHAMARPGQLHDPEPGIPTSATAMPVPGATFSHAEAPAAVSRSADPASIASAPTSALPVAARFSAPERAAHAPRVNGRAASATASTTVPVTATAESTPTSAPAAGNGTRNERSRANTVTARPQDAAAPRATGPAHDTTSERSPDGARSPDTDRSRSMPARAAADPVDEPVTPAADEPVVTRRSMPTRPVAARSRAGENGHGPERRPIDPRVLQLAQHLASSDDPDELTGEMVGRLLNIDVAPRTGRRLLGQARELVNQRARAESEGLQDDPELSVIGGR